MQTIPPALLAAHFRVVAGEPRRLPDTNTSSLGDIMPRQHIPRKPQCKSKTRALAQPKAALMRTRLAIEQIKLAALEDERAKQAAEEARVKAHHARYVAKLELKEKELTSQANEAKSRFPD